MPPSAFLVVGRIEGCKMALPSICELALPQGSNVVIPLAFVILIIPYSVGYNSIYMYLTIY
jgi:hypothetical protein